MVQNKYSCIIIDDEPDAVELLSCTITELFNNVTIAGSFTDWKSAIKALREVNFDILFLDISMPQLNGLDILNLVPELDCEIIFVTAYSEHALDAFQYGAAGYILKPIENVPFTKTVNKAIERVNNKRLAADNRKDSHASIHKISIPNQRGVDYLNTDNILFFEALKRNTRVVETTRELFSSYNIGKFKDMVDESLFFQVHRSFIVNLNHIVRYESIGILTMSNGQSIPVSKNIREDFLKVFAKIQ